MTEHLKRDSIFILLFILIGAGIRLDFLLPVDFVIDADEAIVGLMAKHILEGEGIPVFYYGQHYMGSLEPVLVSVFFKLFGISNATLKAVPLLFSLGFIVIIYFLAYRLYGRFAGLTAAFLAALPPCPLVVWSTKARGGFIEILVIGGLALLLTFRWMEHGGQTLKRTALIGLLLGLGWWTNNQIIYFIFPIGLFFLLRLLNREGNKLSFIFRAIAAHLSVGLAAFVSGGLPFWIYNIRHNFVSFEMFHRSGSRDILEHVKGLFETALPIIFGAKRFWEYNDVFPYSTVLYYSVYALIFGVLLYSRRKQIAALCRFKSVNEGKVELLVIFILSTLSIFALSTFGFLVQAPRYLLPIYVALIPLTAYGIAIIRERSKLIAHLTLILLVSMNILSSYSFGRSIPGEPFVFKQQRVARSHTELITWLENNSIEWVRTNYWIGYRLAFETKEKIKFDLFQEPSQLRIKSYNEEAQRNNIEEMPLVLVPAQAELVEHALVALNYQFQSTQVGDYIVIHNIHPQRLDYTLIDSKDFQVSASHNNAAAAAAIDDDINTRWGSAHPQTPGMYFEVKLSKPEHLAGLRYKLGAWGHDWPRGLQVELEKADGSKETVVNNEVYKAFLYFAENNRCVTLFFNEEDVVKVTLYQLGRDSIFDWTIAELDLFRVDG